MRFTALQKKNKKREWLGRCPDQKVKGLDIYMTSSGLQFKVAY